MQAVFDAHETPDSQFQEEGVLWIDHRLPLRRSTSAPPTAVHARVEVHDTPLSELLLAPAGTRVRAIDQREPLPRSTNATRLPVRFLNDPTATQNLLDVHEIALSELALAPEGLGMR